MLIECFRTGGGVRYSAFPRFQRLMAEESGAVHDAALVDAILPLAPFLYTFSCMHCLTGSLALGGTGLGAMWGEQKAHQMLAEAGFTRVDVKQLEGDVFNNYYVATRG